MTEWTRQQRNLHIRQHNGNVKKVQRTTTWEKLIGQSERARQSKITTYGKATATSKSAAHDDVGATARRERHCSWETKRMAGKRVHLPGGKLGANLTVQFAQWADDTVTLGPTRWT